MVVAWPSRAHPAEPSGKRQTLSPAGFFGQSFSSRIVQRCLCLFVCIEMTRVIA